MDKNKTERMILAALSCQKEADESLRKMSERGEAPEEVLAKFLVGEIYPNDEFLFLDDTVEDEEEDEITRLSCTREEWREMLQSCRKATEGAEYYKVLETYPERVARWAWVGQWPDSIPWEYKWGKMSDLAWAWAWAKDQKTFQDFLEGNPPNLEVSFRDRSWVVASGLILAIERGMVKIPDENLEKFLLRYNSWYRGPGNADVSTMAHAMGLKPESMSEDMLQSLAACWDRAARELGKRGVLLKIPSLQKKIDWECGVYSTIPLLGLEEDAERYLLSQEIVERYCLSTEYSSGYRYETVPVNPSDPFGPRMNKFLFLTGMEEFPSCPSFEEVEEYVLKKSGDRNKK